MQHQASSPYEICGLGRVWGGVGRTGDAKAAAEISTPEEALDFEKETGRVSYVAGQAERAKVFFKRWLHHLNERGSTDSTFSFLEPPPVLWLSGTENDYRFEERLRHVRVYHVYSLWNKKQLVVVRESLLLEVEVPQKSPPSLAN